MSILEKLLVKLIEKPLEKLKKWWGGVDYTAPANDQQTTQPSVPVDFAELDWCWGGFNGKKAEQVDGAQIGSLKVSSDEMSYKWDKGGCEQLGASSRDDAGATICALFCRIDGKWRGGKFDWISTSRKSRDLENIRGGYGGWRKDAIEAADAYAFVIVSDSGRKRTNVITCGR